MKKHFVTVLLFLVLLISLNACRSESANAPVCDYAGAPITKVHLTISFNGDTSWRVEQDMTGMIEHQFELYGLKLSSKKKADMLIGIVVSTETWAHDYGRSGFGGEAYTETATRYTVTFLDKEMNPLWEDSFYYRAEARGSIYERQFGSKASAPYYESFVPVLLLANLELFGDQFLSVLKDAYHSDDTEYGEYLFGLIADIEITEPYQTGVFEIR